MTYYKLQLSKDNEPIAIFKFKEKNSDKFVDNTYLSTIDKFTTMYKNNNSIIETFSKKDYNYGVKLELANGHLEILNSNIIITSNDKIAELPLYSPYKDITEIPLVDNVNCDTNSKQFLDFISSFLFHIKYDGKFYYNVLNSREYDEYFIKQVVNYHEGHDKEKCQNIIISYLYEYGKMRKTYKDVIKSDMVY